MKHSLFVDFHCLLWQCCIRYSFLYVWPSTVMQEYLARLCELNHESVAQCDGMNTRFTLQWTHCIPLVVTANTCRLYGRSVWLESDASCRDAAFTRLASDVGCADAVFTRLVSDASCTDAAFTRLASDAGCMDAAFTRLASDTGYEDIDNIRFEISVC